MTTTRGAHPYPVTSPAGYPAVPVGTGTGAPGRYPVRPAASVAGAELQRLVATRTHKRRYQLRPWLVLAAVIVGALAAHLFPSARGLAWTAIMPAVVLAARVWVRHKRRDHRAYAFTCIAVGAAWMAMVIRWGPAAGPGRLALLTVVVPGIFPLAWLWWQCHRVRPRGRRRQTADDGPDPVITAYAENFAGRGRRGEGTWLTGPQIIPAGRAYTVNLTPGRHTPEELIRNLPAISSALAPLGIVRSQLVLELMPGDGDGEAGPDHLARLTVLERRSPQKEIQEFTGSTLVPGTGLFADGPYPDGEMAMARLYKTDEHGQPIRTASGLYVGAQGSGKSRLLEHKALEHMLSGIFLVWFIDGMGGSSMPGLLDHVDWPAVHPEEWVRVLKAAARLRIHRTRKQTARREGVWHATADEPFIQVIIDEAHRVLRNPDCVRLVKMLLQEAEKTGIGVDLVTQVPLMTELGDQSGAAGAHVIRGLAKDGNVAVFRTGDEWTKTVTVGTWEADPRTLPQRPGMHFLAGAATRQVPVRAIRAADPDAWARRAPALRLADDEAQACDGDTGDYRNRWDRFAAHVAGFGGAVDTGDINGQLDAMLGRPATGPAATGAPPAPGGRTAMSLCLEVLRRHGRLKRKQIIDEIRAVGHDYSESAVAQALRALATTGAITNKGGEHGEWTLTESRDDVADHDEETNR
jgi:hypothetical protein